MSRLIRSRERKLNHSKQSVERRRRGECDMEAKLRTEVLAELWEDNSVPENTRTTVVDMMMGLWQAICKGCSFCPDSQRHGIHWRMR